MDGHVVVGGAPSAPSMSPTSPMSLHRHDSVKRKRSTVESSPGSIGDEDHSLIEPEKKRQPGVKRACNECRQQKPSPILSMAIGRAGDACVRLTLPRLSASDDADVAAPLCAL
ncbi:hypothetical protein GGR55DRAFT_695537 [Xylaria sp. FL0064]|nr:hypothetical protein GGR55DRAFT_695537 [Xylaria sp. FL0064]